ncbi:Transcription factor IIIB 90 kDa subunit [Orchesella cincta]|uniref:B-related factor 1 n=2 Tax=Orchesella TaxID=48705 RepID=A0A1D2MBF2_ORCCI|nr:Transcription factor IIIB 90 kDa subunit [Orchesella cincta]
MSGVISCRQCGCSEIDSDPARGDAVCTNCGYVLEESIIVSEVAFEEDGHGGSSAIGQFVSAESRGGGGISGAPTGFHSGVGKESREITLRSAKKKIVEVAQQLRLNQHCIDMAFNFFKMALHKQLTKGRKNSLTIAACVYMTCRIEGTPHLLIDFSDVVQMDVYALGRAYVQISRALYINIPAVDPCMYILRFAHKFELGDKTHDVAMTALRLVQRMKRDWIHLGRRPSGLCGAALLIAARLHNFSRTIHDIISVVKVHETTLRKRLIEFGETPSSSLTLDEFMSVDLEEEHDPPSFKAARIKDRDRLQRLLDEEVNDQFQQIQQKIEEELDKRRSKALKKRAEAALRINDTVVGSSGRETDDATRFIVESTMSAINEVIAPVNHGAHSDRPASPNVRDIDRMLMPPPSTVDENQLNQGLAIQQHLRLPSPVPDLTVTLPEESEDGELDLDGIDDNEIDAYLMTREEALKKKETWEKINADYIQQQKIKQEQLEKERLEGKPEKKKKKKQAKPKPTFQAKSANEAIKIMLMERKMSNKINYDVLRSLTSGVDGVEGLLSGNDEANVVSAEPITVIESGPVVPPARKRKLTESETEEKPIVASTSKKSKTVKIKTESKPSVADLKVGILEQPVVIEETSAEVVVESGPVNVEDFDDENESDVEEELSARQLLTQFRGEDEGDDDYY